MPQPRKAHALLRALHPGPLISEQALAPGGCTIGRDARRADFLVRRQDVSREHARLSLARDGQWQISDLQSTNGILVNGQRINKSSALHHGDVISLGRARVPDFEFLVDAAQAAPRRVQPGGVGPWTIGRDLDHPISLPADPVVSLDHARLRMLPDGLCIEDLASRNGTWVNGHRVRRSRIDPGSRIVIGGHQLRIEMGKQGPLIEIHSLQQALGVQADAVQLGRGSKPVSFRTRPGCLQLICLPDVQDRRALVQTLTGLDQPAGGQLHFSEAAIDHQIERRRDRIGEVHPDCRPESRQRLDHWLGDLACLALAKDLSAGHRHELITTTLEALGLSKAARRRWQDLKPLEQQLGLVAAGLLHRPGLLLVEHQADDLSGPDSLRLLERLRGLAGSTLSVLVICDQPLDAAEDDEWIALKQHPHKPSQSRPLRPRPHRASLARQRVLLRHSLAGWLGQPLALAEALALPVLLAAALWLALPERAIASLGLIAVLVSTALASAFQVSRWQPGLVYLTRRHLLLSDALVGLSASAAVIGLTQAGLASLTIMLLGGEHLDTGLPLLLASMAIVPVAVTAGLACGLAAGPRPLLALLLVATLVALLIFAAALFHAQDETAGLLLTRLSELSPIRWSQVLLEAINHQGNWLRPLLLLLGQCVLFLALARVFLRRRLY